MIIPTSNPSAGIEIVRSRSAFNRMNPAASRWYVLLLLHHLVGWLDQGSQAREPGPR